MVQLQSKLVPISVTCADYVHPWTESCLEAIAGCYLHSAVDSFRIYSTVYTLALLMRGRIPTKDDLIRTVHGILQSTAFLSATGFGYAFFLCTIRRLLGKFYFMTASAIPAFLGCIFGILIERPSRRLLLCLYVSNVATETVWNMAVARNYVRPVKHGVVMLYSACMALLLMYYKGGMHKGAKADDKTDTMFGVLRFIVGPYEEKDYNTRSSQADTFYRQHTVNVLNNPSTSKGGSSWHPSTTPRKNLIYHLITQALRAYKKLINKIKCFDRHNSCPHPFSCVYYTLQGTGKMFTVGLGIQVALKLVLNIKRIFKSPSDFKSVFLKKDILSLGTYLGGFSGLFRACCCVLRRVTGKDSHYHALPAGLIAGIAFTQYPDTTVALYVLWKMAQITYNLGIEQGYLPSIPGFTIFLYSLSTAILFHAALLEPTNLRPSYWKFLHNNSGGRIASMSRKPLDVWGLNTSESLALALKASRIVAKVQYYGGCACS